MWSDKSTLPPGWEEKGDKMRRDFNDAANGTTPDKEDSERSKSADRPETALNLEPTIAEKREGAALDQQNDSGMLERMQAAAQRRQDRDRGMSLER